jgi:gamma-glutamyltranspeptidase / glutathione hydrolase
MMVGDAVARTVHAPTGMVASADHLASSAGVAALRAGGTAADAAVAAGAVLAVTNQHQCGIGGDLFALVHPPGGPVAALCAAGRAGSGADAVQARAEGYERLPAHGDVRSVTVPGCVDGWLALHRRFGRLPLRQVLEAAVTYAATGFPVSPLLSAVAPAILDLDGVEDYRDPAMAAGGRLPPGTLIRRPGVAAALEAVVDDGRAGLFAGPFGEGLLDLGHGLFTRGDLARHQAEWVEPLAVEVWGHTVHVPPPPSQGYLTLAAAGVAAGLPLPDDADDPRGAHLLAEAARVVGTERDALLHEGAAGDDLIATARLDAWRRRVDGDRRADLPPPTAAGDTTVCCAVDRERMGVTLIQSNGSAWGARIVEPWSGVFLHNRGIGFSLATDHPARYAGGRRPPHTLSPALVTRPDGSLRAVLGTMGGDAQPQIVLQLLARLLHHDQSPGTAVRSGRWVLGAGDGSPPPASEHAGFDLWGGDGPGHLAVEAHAPSRWDEDLTTRGHVVRRSAEQPDHAFGHAQVIELTDGVLAGVADSRSLDGAASGY